MSLRDLAGKRVLVTGGAGFIGSHLVDRLLACRTARVVVVDNMFLGKTENLASAMAEYPEQVCLYREDAGDASAMQSVMARERVEVVFNLATKALLYSFFNPEGAFAVNVRIAEVVLQLLRHGAYETLVHCSSSEVFGTARAFPMTEDHPLQPETSYAAGKAAADLMVRSFINMFGLDIRIIRPFNNYGPRQNDGELAAIIPLTLRRIAAGERPVVYGDGLQTRDFIHVSDTVEALVLGYRHPGMRGQEVNIGAGREIAILEILKSISKHAGYQGDFDFRPARPADVRRHSAGTERARSLMGFAPRVELDEGIRSTVAWYRQREARK
jgi:UDP-glucose 4-epimerase